MMIAIPSLPVVPSSPPNALMIIMSDPAGRDPASAVGTGVTCPVPNMVTNTTNTVMAVRYSMDVVPIPLDVDLRIMRTPFCVVTHGGNKVRKLFILHMIVVIGAKVNCNIYFYCKFFVAHLI